MAKIREISLSAGNTLTLGEQGKSFDFMNKKDWPTSVNEARKLGFTTDSNSIEQSSLEKDPQLLFAMVLTFADRFFGQDCFFNESKNTYGFWSPITLNGSKWIEIVFNILGEDKLKANFQEAEKLFFGKRWQEYSKAEPADRNNIYSDAMSDENPPWEIAGNEKKLTDITKKSETDVLNLIAKAFARWAKQDTKINLSAPKPVTFPTFQQITKDRKKQEQSTYVPVVQKGEKSTSKSTFMGTPALLKGEEWPTCSKSGKAMLLVLQIDGTKAPAEVAKRLGKKIFQFFYSVSEDMADDSKAALIRIVDPKKVVAKKITRPSHLNKYKPLTIAKWQELTDYPHSEEKPFESNGLSDILEPYVTQTNETKAKSSLQKIAKKIDSDGQGKYSIKELDQIAQMLNAKSGDKVLGWPSWAQDVEYPKCPKCKKKMSLFLQMGFNQKLDSDLWTQVHVAGLIADEGKAFIFQCNSHQSEFKLNWQTS